MNYEDAIKPLTKVMNNLQKVQDRNSEDAAFHKRQLAEADQEVEACAKLLQKLNALFE